MAPNAPASLNSLKYPPSSSLSIIPTLPSTNTGTSTFFSRNSPSASLFNNPNARSPVSSNPKSSNSRLLNTNAWTLPFARDVNARICTSLLADATTCILSDAEILVRYSRSFGSNAPATNVTASAPAKRSLYSWYGYKRRSDARMGGAAMPSSSSAASSTALMAALEEDSRAEVMSSMLPPNNTASQFTLIAGAPDNVSCLDNLATSYLFLNDPVVGSVLLHSGIITNVPSAPAPLSLTGPIQSLGPTLVGSTLANLH
mmetsp:Transcript_28695/g.84603  ORF Transcript_28695/g.84603 Transcript_28695/m.84603 type:complete len:258 (+) Transcript_28695:193-966(+)